MTPQSLQPNDLIHIISPSGSVNAEFIDGAINVFTGWGLRVSEGEFARTEYGRFGGTTEQRMSDLQQALNDPDIRAILCSRGGYGVAQIIDRIDFSEFVKHPKWLIGFSDITILHNAISNLGIESIHGIMAKQLAELPEDSEQVQRLKAILFGKRPSYILPGELNNRTGKAQGKLIGGNISVFMGLRGSQYDFNYQNAILFIEDIGEKPYQVDRLMQNLRFSGSLEQLSGLIVGQFNEYDEDPLMMQSMQEIILNAVSEYSYPVCFNFPAGHVDYNLPIINGAKTELVVTKDRTTVLF